MAMNFKTVGRQESQYTASTLEKMHELWAKEVVTSQEQLTAEFKKCTHIKDAINTVKKELSSAKVVEDELCKPALEELAIVKPSYTPADACISLENALVDYAKKVVTYASTMITTVKKYSANIYDLFVKKLRICKSIDLDQFTGMDTSMRMTIITWGDYMEFNKGIQVNFEQYGVELCELISFIGDLRKAINEGKPIDIISDKITNAVYNNRIMTILKSASLIGYVEDTLPTGATGIVSLSEGTRFKELESSRIISEAGWTSLEKYKAAWFQNPERIASSINKVYSQMIDFMEETRRFSSDFCVKEPHLCAALTTYSSIVARQVDIYTRVYDACWNTLIRLVEACYREEG
jgi:hypothetical protein